MAVWNMSTLRASKEPKSWLILRRRKVGMVGSSTPWDCGSYHKLIAENELTIPKKQKALFHAAEAALKSGAMSADFAVSTTMLNRSS